MTETTVMAVFLLDFIILRCEFLLKITTGFFLRPLLWLLLTVLLLLSIRVVFHIRCGRDLFSPDTPTDGRTQGRTCGGLWGRDLRMCA